MLGGVFGCLIFVRVGLVLLDYVTGSLVVHVENLQVVDLANLITGICAGITKKLTTKERAGK